MTTPLSSPAISTEITRREAIKRAALFLGVAISPSLLRGALAAATPRTATGTLVQLSDARRSITSIAVERILPRTDTPGALDVGVPAFIELMYASYMTEEEKLRLERGLQRLDELSRKSSQQGFIEASPEQQDTALRNLADSSEVEDAKCFQQLRTLTVLGYFTSKPVGTTVLQYDPIPGRYEGCIPLSEVGKAAWYM
ncbi:MAG: gluconate 2-dehydrogenase subunit 3 family protein [Opitutus sp.]